MLTRTIIEGVEWLIGREVCKAACIENTAQAIGTVQEKQKALWKIKTAKGKQLTWFITREGAIDLLQRSKKSAAKKLLESHFQIKAVESEPETIKPIHRRALYDPDTVTVRENRGVLRYVYNLCAKMEQILLLPEHSALRGLQMPLARLMSLEALVHGPIRNIRATETTVRIITMSEVYPQLNYQCKKWLKRDRKGSAEIKWINRYINKEILPSSVLLKIIKDGFPEIYALMRDDNILWEGKEAYITVDVARFADWAGTIARTRPFPIGVRNRKITPKPLVIDIYEHLPGISAEKG